MVLTSQLRRDIYAAPEQLGTKWALIFCCNFFSNSFQPPPIFLASCHLQVTRILIALSQCLFHSTFSFSSFPCVPFFLSAWPSFILAVCWQHCSDVLCVCVCVYVWKLSDRSAQNALANPFPFHFPYKCKEISFSMKGCFKLERISEGHPVQLPA